MENLQAVLQGIILDAVNQKFAEIPNKELALSCQAYAEQIAPEVVRQLFGGKADVDALRDITTRHAKNELTRIVTKFGTSVMLRVNDNLPDGVLKNILNDEISDTLLTGWETYLDGGNWEEAIKDRAKSYAAGYAKQASHKAFSKAKEYFPENRYYMAFCDDVDGIATDIVTAVESGETIENICVSVQQKVKSTLIRRGTDFANEKVSEGVEATVNYIADSMREKGRGKHNSAYNKKVDWVAETFSDSLKGNAGTAINRLAEGDDVGAVATDLAKGTLQDVANESLNKYAGEYVSDTVNYAAKKLHVKGTGSRKINRRIDDAGNVVTDTLTENVTSNVMDVLSGNKDFETAVKDIAVDTAKQSAQIYVKEHGAELAKEAIETITHNAAKQISNKATKELVLNVGGKLANVNAVTGVAGAIYDIGTSFKTFMDGEITKAELLRQLGEKGSAACVSSVYATMGGMVGAVGGPAGVAIGSAVGSMVGYVASSMLYGAVLNQFEREEAAKQHAEAVHSFCEEAIRQMRKERAEFEARSNELLQNRAESVLRGFDAIDKAIIKCDFDQFSSGLNEITKSFGKELQFTTFEEFDKFMESDEDFVL